MGDGREDLDHGWNSKYSCLDTGVCSIWGFAVVLSLLAFRVRSEAVTFILMISVLVAENRNLFTPKRHQGELEVSAEQSPSTLSLQQRWALRFSVSLHFSVFRLALACACSAKIPRIR